MSIHNLYSSKDIIQITEKIITDAINIFFNNQQITIEEKEYTDDVKKVVISLKDKTQFKGNKKMLPLYIKSLTEFRKKYAATFKYMNCKGYSKISHYGYSGSGGCKQNCYTYDMLVDYPSMTDLNIQAIRINFTYRGETKCINEILISFYRGNNSCNIINILQNINPGMI